jgi:hypothetical protein
VMLLCLLRGWTTQLLPAGVLPDVFLLRSSTALRAPDSSLLSSGPVSISDPLCAGRCADTCDLALENTQDSEVTAL